MESGLPGHRSPIEAYIEAQKEAFSVPLSKDMLQDFTSWCGRNVALLPPTLQDARKKRTELVEQRRKLHKSLVKELQLQDNAEQKKRFLDTIEVIQVSSGTI